MERIIDSNKDFIHFSEFYVFFFNVPIAFKKLPDIYEIDILFL